MNPKTLNKLQNTSVGDVINYYVNGIEKSGTVTSISGSYITLFKSEDGSYSTMHIDETFFVKDILVANKSWNDMSMEERGELLVTVKAYSPRYLQKTWEQLPKELQNVIKEGAPIKEKKPSNIPKVEPKGGYERTSEIGRSKQGFQEQAPRHDIDDKAKVPNEMKDIREKIIATANAKLRKSMDLEKDATTSHERKTSNRFYGRNQGATPTVIDPKSPNTEEYYGSEFPYSHPNATNPSKGHQSKEGQATQARRSLHNPTALRGDKYDSEKPFSRGSQSSYTRSRTGDARDTSDDDHMRDQYGARRRTAEDERRDDEKELQTYRQGKIPEKKPEPKELSRGKAPINTKKALEKLQKSLELLKIEQPKGESISFGDDYKPKTTTKKPSSEVKESKMSKEQQAKIQAAQDKYKRQKEWGKQRQAERKEQGEVTDQTRFIADDGSVHTTEASRNTRNTAYGQMSGKDKPPQLYGEDKNKALDLLEHALDLLKSGVEQGAYGNVGGRPNMGVSTQFDMDADDDYEGATHQDFKEQFKHEEKKPEVSHEGHNKKKGTMTTGTGGAFNAVNNNIKRKKENA